MVVIERHQIRAPQCLSNPQTMWPLAALYFTANSYRFLPPLPNGGTIITIHHVDTYQSFADSLSCSQLWSCQEIPENSQVNERQILEVEIQFNINNSSHKFFHIN